MDLWLHPWEHRCLQQGGRGGSVSGHFSGLRGLPRAAGRGPAPPPDGGVLHQRGILRGDLGQLVGDLFQQDELPAPLRLRLRADPMDRHLQAHRGRGHGRPERVGALGERRSRPGRLLGVRGAGCRQDPRPRADWGGTLRRHHPCRDQALGLGGHALYHDDPVVHVGGRPDLVRHGGRDMGLTVGLAYRCSAQHPNPVRVDPPGGWASRRSGGGRGGQPPVGGGHRPGRRSGQGRLRQQRILPGGTHDHLQAPRVLGVGPGETLPDQARLCGSLREDPSHPQVGAQGRPGGHRILRQCAVPFRRAG